MNGAESAEEVMAHLTALGPLYPGFLMNSKTDSATNWTKIPPRL